MTQGGDLCPVGACWYFSPPKYAASMCCAVALTGLWIGSEHFDIRTQHTGTSHGIKNGVDICVSMIAKITVCARTNSDDRCPEDAAEQNACMSILHEKEGQNRCPERSFTELGDTKS
jgi:hypothetical protein